MNVLLLKKLKMIIYIYAANINEPYTIYDWNLLDERLRYVALTRASDISYINIF